MTGVDMTGVDMTGVDMTGVDITEVNPPDLTECSYFLRPNRDLQLQKLQLQGLRGESNTRARDSSAPRSAN